MIPARGTPTVTPHRVAAYRPRWGGLGRAREAPVPLQEGTSLSLDRPADELDAAIQFLLQLARQHLAMDVAFVSQLLPSERVFRYVSADASSGIEVEAGDPLEQSYCHYVTAGQVPQLLRDPREHPITAAMDVTEQLPVGTHLSVPLILSDGTLYGTFCCFSHEVLDGVNERDLEVVRMLAAIVARYVESVDRGRREQDARRAVLSDLTLGHGLHVLFQPIAELEGGRVAGYEALCRFPTLGQDPATTFAEAWQLGIGISLELEAVRGALAALNHLDDDVYVSVNVSPDTLIDEGLLAALGTSHPSRILLELTEHAAVRDYEALAPTMQKLAALGVRLAVDDVGAGFSGLDHILRLEPAVLKLDGSLVRDVHRRSGKQAMIAALVTFAARTGAALVAEQIENEDELQALRVLGVGLGQGYHLGRPGPIDDSRDPALA